MSKAKLSKVAQAYAHAKRGRDVLHAHCRCMEVTEDKAGIVWERWLTPQGKSVFVFATPTWWEISAPVCFENDIAKYLAALESFVLTGTVTP